MACRSAGLHALRCWLLVLPIRSSLARPARRLVFSADGSDRYVHPIEHEDSYPYLVSVRASKEHMCGGTLIRPDWVLTAAHCMSTSAKFAQLLDVSMPHRCPWQRPHQKRNQVLCEDGTYVSDWRCVDGGHGDRVQCPANYPEMCADKTCGGNKEHCCSKDGCYDGGGRRPCPKSHSHTTSPVDLVVVHSSYDSQQYKHDIALLHLARPFDGVPLVKLQNRSGSHAGSLGLIAGWGSSDSECVVYEGLLKEGDASIVGTSKCSKFDQFFLGTRRICTARVGAGSTSNTGCGDSGGPLLIEEDGDYVQVGVVSYTSEGDRDIFTRVYAYMNWILDVIAKPSSTSLLIAPHCVGDCCDSAEWLDANGNDCLNWQEDFYCEAGSPKETEWLLGNCSATCEMCPKCSPWNAECCDDDTFVDSQGFACWAWYEDDCWTVSQWGYSDNEIEVIKRKCPASCGVCGQGDRCLDDYDFLDERGYSCYEWAGFDCSTAVENFGYSPGGARDLLYFCLVTCGSCGAVAPTTRRMEATVGIMMTLVNVSHRRLVRDKALAASLEQALAKGIAREAGHNVKPGHVRVMLTPSHVSTLVSAVITPPARAVSDAVALGGALERAALPDVLAGRVRDTRGIGVVVTGPIRVEGMTIMVLSGDGMLPVSVTNVTSGKPTAGLPCSATPAGVCTSNKDELCMQDPTCSWYPPRRGGIGCNAGGVGQNCRFCGFKEYLPCDTDFAAAAPVCTSTPSPVCAGLKEPCLLDYQCTTLPPALVGLGCNAGGLQDCRFCGFGEYPDCPKKAFII